MVLEGRIYVGRIPRDMENKKLEDYFSKYGIVTKALIVCDKTSNRSRGFGFVHFFDPTVLDQTSVLRDKHTIDGKRVVVKKSLPKEELYSTYSTKNPKQVFVRGLTSTLDKAELCRYFQTFGRVTNVVIAHDKTNHMPLGFGYIHFDTEDTVTKVLVKNFHEILGKHVEVKQAFLKNANPGGASGVNAGGAFDGRVIYVPQSTAVRYPYSASSSPSYRYGGAYEGYGLGGYGNAGDGSCGIANISNTLYANRPSQSPSYGALGNGGDDMSGLMDRYPIGASRYGNQSYGYSNSGGEQHMRSGYIGSNGNSRYRGGSLRSDPPQRSGGNGSRYGVAQTRQNQAYSYGNFDGSGFDPAGGEQHMRSSYRESNQNSGYPGGSLWSDPPQRSGDYGRRYGDTQSRQNQQR